MRWWLLGRLMHDEPEDSQNGQKLEEAEEKLKEAEEKLAHTEAKAPEIAKAVASARRAKWKIDKFTEEISRSFGRLNNG